MNPTKIGAMQEVDNSLQQQILRENDAAKKLALLRQQNALLKNILNIQQQETAVN